MWGEDATGSFYFVECQIYMPAFMRCHEIVGVNMRLRPVIRRVYVFGSSLKDGRSMKRV